MEVKKLNNPILMNAVIVFAATILFVPFLGATHLFDWDEINFAECAREMLVTGDYSMVKINFLPFWEKPPLFIWLQAISMNIFGVNEFAARFPNAVVGIITLLVLFNLGKQIFGQRFGLLWILAYAGSLLPHLYFKSGIIDPLFNLFIFCSLYFAIIYFNENINGERNIILSGLFTGLAILTKGPVAFLIFLLCIVVFVVLKRKLPSVKIKGVFYFLISTFFIGSIWFIEEAVNGRMNIVTEFIEYQIRLLKTEDSGHGGPFFYHVIVLLIGCFPSSIFALMSIGKKNEFTPFQKEFTLWLKILFWVVLILFSIVKTKIVHYSSLCYIPLTFMAALTLENMFNGKNIWRGWIKTTFLLIGTVIGIALTFAFGIDRIKPFIINNINDEFAKSNLSANVIWNGWEPLIGLIFLAGIFISIRLFNKFEPQKGVIILYALTIVSINFASIVITPKVEGYSQNAAIEFYRSLSGKDVYVETLGFKSYAQLFYTNKTEPVNKNSLNKEWLLTGDIDKETYFVCKVNKAEEYFSAYPELIELYRKNGFVFLKRDHK